ncbi:MAG: C25 family cysteine peptidase [Bacteroidota bacterium]
MKLLVLFNFLWISIHLTAQNPFPADVLTDTPPLRNIVRSDKEITEVNYTFKGFNAKAVDTKYGEMTLIRISDFTHTKSAGKPALPMHTDLVALKQDKNYELEVIIKDSIVFENVMLAPAKKPARDTEGAPEPEFEMDTLFYNQDTQYPDKPINISDIQTYRKLPMAIIDIVPFRYNPAEKILVYYPEITYKIKHNSRSNFISGNYLSGKDAKLAQNIVLNNTAFSDEKPRNDSIDAPGYIIIADNMFSEAAQRMATWKRQMGLNVTLLESAGWSYESIRDTLSGFYESENPPSYFLIIGDHDQVPGRIRTAPSGEAFATDLYYACFDGPADYFPDMAHGRLSVSTAAEALLVVDKIINYEASPPTESHFYNQGTNCAQFQDDELNGYATRRFTHTSEDIRDYMMTEQGYDVERIYYTDQNINPTNYNNGWYSNGEPIKEELLKSNGFDWNGGQWDIVNAINDGRFYLFHRDHGYAGGSGWAHPYFVQSSIGYLENGHLLPVVFSINCHTGEFKLPESFAETLQRHPDGGAVGVFAASYYSYSGYNDGLSAGFIDAMFPEPGLVPEFGEGGIPNPNIAPHDQMLEMGHVLNQGLLRMGETWGISRYTNELFHYFGDPAMRLHIQQPELITATHADTLFYETDSTLNVTGISAQGVTATIVTSQKTLAVKRAEDNEATLAFENIEDDYIILTLSKVHHQPYTDTIFVAGKPKAVAEAEKLYTCNGEIAFKSNSYYNPETLTWHFGDGATSQETNPVHEYTQNGSYQVQLIATNRFGEDTISIQDSVTVNRPVVSEISSEPICESGTVSFEMDEDARFSWYTPEGELLHTGNDFTTDTINENQNYLVRKSSLSESYTGKYDLSGDTSRYHMFCGLIFDAYQDFTLQSVKTYAKDEGARVIQLRDSLFNVLISDTVFIPQGENRIELGWEIPAGEKYKLVANDNHQLAYNITGAEYPYEVPEVLSIHGSTFIPDPQKYYYAFYDWEVTSYTCHSPMKTIAAEIEQPAEVSFEAQIDDPHIELINNTEHADVFVWDFGDGNTTSESDPSHTYEENDDYTITLTAENVCGPVSAEQNIQIKTVGYPETLIDDFKIFPNPASDKITVSWDSRSYSIEKIELNSVSGKTVKVVSPGKEHRISIQTGNLNSGVYFIKIKTANQTFLKKIVLVD